MRIAAFTAAAVSAVAISAAAFADYQDEADIVDTAIAAGDFTTLVAAVEAAGLVDALRGDGPLTVFAPNDAAFAALPAGTVDELLLPENADQLEAVLTYHVVPGEYLAAETPAGEYELETLQGSTVDLVVGEDGTVTVDGATVIAADIAASNGVIHAIDAVIMPE
ncbi:fasciclin domain-containing protein [Glycocaulis profundi]|nr:fasciclin domain-containing protein [Glycocaulis profundi]